MTHRDEEPHHHPLYGALLWTALLWSGLVCVVLGVYCLLVGSFYYAGGFLVTTAVLIILTGLINRYRWK